MARRRRPPRPRRLSRETRGILEATPEVEEPEAKKAPAKKATTKKTTASK
jgi:hypothetical protein